VLASICVVLLATGQAAIGRPSSVRATAQTVYVSPGGSDKGSCAQASPCATIDKAYHVASPGGVVELAAGTYPAQTLRPDDSKSAGPDVVIGPAPGASVRLAGFVTGNDKTGAGAKHFELRGVQVGSLVRLSRGAEAVTLRDVDAIGIDFTSARDIRVLGGDYGPLADGVSHINACGVPGCFPSEGILIDGAVFHDYTVTDPALHSECLLVWPARRLTIRNSTFRNCTDFDVLVKPYKTALVGSPGDVVFENNLFDEPIVGDACRCNRGGNAIAITQGEGEAWSNVTIRYNSSLGGIRVDPAITNVTVEGNIARKDQRTSCQSNVVFSHNVWSGTTCSSTDQRAALGTVFVSDNSSTFDLQLRRGAAAIARGDPKTAPRTDVRGAWRPTAFPPDIGAYQREPALALAGKQIGSTAIGDKRADVADVYGPALKRSSAKLPTGRWGLVAQYRVPGGRISLVFVEDRVTEISTTSRLYRTAHGVAVGEPYRGPLETSTATTCVRSARGLYVRPRRQASPVVAELIVVPRNSVPACAVPKR
jgi:hypothetical protein